MSKSESEISREIQDFLNELGLAWFWRNQVYKGRVKSGAYLHTGKKGISDFIIVEWLVVIFMELKDDEGEQSEDQKKFQAHCIKNNQEYWVIRSKEEFKLKLIERGFIL